MTMPHPHADIPRTYLHRSWDKAKKERGYCAGAWKELERELDSGADVYEFLDKIALLRIVQGESPPEAGLPCPVCGGVFLDRSPAPFQECQACAAKPGTPTLCADCLKRREEYQRSL